MGHGADEDISASSVGMDVADAAYHLAYGYPGGVEVVAKRMGMPLSTLEKKLNPNNTTHNLSIREAVSLQHFCGQATVLHAMAHALGYECSRALPDESGGDPVEAVMLQQVATAEFMRAAADIFAAGGEPSKNEMRRIYANARDLQTTTGNLLSILRKRMKVPPRPSY